MQNSNNIDTSGERNEALYSNFNKLLESNKYPKLAEFVQELVNPNATIIGREEEANIILASMLRPRLCNVILLAEAGSGKTTLVQGMSHLDSNRLYLELNPAALQENPATMPANLKSIFAEITDLIEELGHEVVLFVDEFHQILAESPASLEVLKPLLANSGSTGVRLIAATTYDEFDEFIKPNQALIERLQRIDLTQPSEDVVKLILQDLVDKCDLGDKLKNPDLLFSTIYELTERYLPASSQPRKSIKILDLMIGLAKHYDRPLDMDLLTEAFKQSENIDIDFMIDVSSIESKLSNVVKGQEFAIKVISQKLHTTIAKLNDETKPKMSLLFTGTTGVGKTEMTKALADVIFDDPRRLIRFDMSEYAQDSSMEQFRTTLTSKVWARPFSIVLIDEVEKAASTVTRLLLQVLDDGRLSDANGKEVSFLNTYIIITTNAAQEVMADLGRHSTGDKFDEDGNAVGLGEEIAKFESLIKRSLTSTQADNKFPPELIGRLDGIVPFSPLTDNIKEEIAVIKLRKLNAKLEKYHNIQLSWTEKVLDYIVYDKAAINASEGGARNIAATIDSEITTLVAAFINENPRVRQIALDIKGDLSFGNYNVLKSIAYPVVANVRGFVPQPYDNSHKKHQKN